MSDTVKEFFRSRGLGAAQRPIVRPVLVVVDLTYAFTDSSSPLGCDAETAIEHTARLLATARSSGRPRIFTKVEYDRAGEALAATFLEKIPSLRQSVPGSRWTQIDDRLAPQADEPVITKLFPSAFFGTCLASFLAASDCDGVVVTGASTSGCVRATVVDAMQYGYRALVPRNAVADRAGGPHDAALFDIEAKYGSVVSTEAAERCLLGEHAGSRGTNG